ncbi:hypothetical protein ACWGE0_15455 [Lentzea sp. NPDC054927]
MTPAEMDLFNAIEKMGRVRFAGAGREIGAGFLSEQLLRQNGCRPRVLTLCDVTVIGQLDLEAGEVGFPVEFEGCVFDHAPNIEQATLAGLYFTDCQLPGLCASQVRLHDGLALHNCHVNGCVQLTGAHVAGQLDMEDCVIAGSAEGALEADGLRVEQDVYFSGKFRITGPTRMIGAHIGGEFICDGAVFRNAGTEKTLELSRLVVREHVFWRHGFSVEGEVDLSGAEIAGRLICHGARFFNLRGMALQAPNMTVRQEAEFSRGCSVDGELSLVGCQIGGWLDFTGGQFRNPGGRAIDLTLASTVMNLVMRAGTLVHGKLSLSNAKIGGAFRAQGGHFQNRFDTAIEALGLKVHSDISLGVRDGERFRAQGQVVLSDAHVGGNLNCTGGRFENKERDALVARGIKVDRNVLLRREFFASGRVDFAGASIDGKVDFRDAWFESSSEAVRFDRVRVGHAMKFDRAAVGGGVRMCSARIGTEVTFDGAALGGETALKLKGTQIRGTLRLNFAEPPEGSVDLRQVTTGSFDDREGDLPPGDDTQLDDFVYGALHDTSVKMSKRLKWLKGRAYLPQVYLQLATTYARAGHHDQATTVLVEKEEARRLAWKGFPGPLFRMCWWVLKPTVGYGYRPFRVLVWLGLLQIAGGIAFSRVDAFDAARNGVQMEWYHSWLYTFDLLVPVVSLHHSELWVPQGATRWWALAFTVLGWALAICLVTGIGRLFKRDER